MNPKETMRALLLLLTCAGCVAQPVKESVYEASLKSTVSVKAGPSGGSGVVIQRGAQYFVWTCAHVVADRGLFGDVKGVAHSDILIESWRYNKNLNLELETVAQATVIFFLPESDIALLSVDTPGMSYRGAVFAVDRIPRLGDKIFTLGHPFRDSLINSLTVGVISGTGRYDDPSNPSLVADQLDIGINPGNSGGGVFFDDSGALAGLTHAMLSRTHIGFMIPTRAIRNDAANFGFGWAVDPDGVVPEYLKK